MVAHKGFRLPWSCSLIEHGQPFAKLCAGVCFAVKWRVFCIFFLLFPSTFLSKALAHRVVNGTSNCRYSIDWLALAELEKASGWVGMGLSGHISIAICNWFCVREWLQRLKGFECMATHRFVCDALNQGQLLRHWVCRVWIKELSWFNLIEWLI